MYLGNALSHEPLLSFPLNVFRWQFPFLLLIRTQKWVLPNTYAGRKKLFLRPFMSSNATTNHFPKTKEGEFSIGSIFTHLPAMRKISWIYRSIENWKSKFCALGEVNLTH
jgi:hypothetical protein